MERYNEYKDSGVQWIREIPSHWEISSLRRILKKYSSKGYENYPLLSVTREKGVILRGAKGDDGNNNIIPDDLSGYKHVKLGQFVINKMKSWQGSYGVSEFEGLVSPAYFVYHLNFDNKKFFSWAIRSKCYVPFFMQYSKGIRVDQWDLTPDNVKCIPFFIPPKEEQEKIVTYLEKCTSMIDEAIAQQQKMIDLLNERKQIIINNAVTKGLDPGVPMKDSGVDWIGEIPQHWKITRIKNCISDSQSGIWGDDERDNIEDKICVRVADFDYERGYVNHDNLTYRHYGHEFTSQKQLRSGDLLLEKSGGGDRYPVGRVVRYNLDDECIATCSNFIQKLTVTFNVNSDYLYYLFKAIYYARISGLYYTQTTGIQNLRVNEYLTNIVYLPDKTEQNEIADYLNNYSSKIEEAINQKRKNIFLLQERKQIIINDVVTGKVRVI